MQKNTTHDSRARSKRIKYNTQYQSAFRTQENITQNNRAHSTRVKIYNTKYQSAFHTRKIYNTKYLSVFYSRKIKYKISECVPHAEKYNTYFFVFLFFFYIINEIRTQHRQKIYNTKFRNNRAGSTRRKI